MIKLRRGTGCLAPRLQGNQDRRGKLKGLDEWVRGRLADQGDLTLDELHLELEQVHDIWVHRASVGYWLHRLGLGQLVKTTGWAPVGERLIDHSPFGHWYTQTFIAALRHDGLTAPWVIDGPINRRFFNTCVETQLLPTLKPGDIVILDNSSSHKSTEAAEMLKPIGAWFLFLPPYSPI